MNVHAFVTDVLSDERLLANLVAIHIGLGLVLIVSILIRNAVLAGGGRMLRWFGLDRVEGVSEEAARTVRSLTFWSALFAMLAIIAGGIAYQTYGRDVRHDVLDWVRTLTAADLIGLGWTGARLVLLAIGLFLIHRMILRILVSIESGLQHALPDDAEEDLQASHEAREQSLRNWFVMLRRFTSVVMVLAWFWGAGRIANIPRIDIAVAFCIRILTICCVARLLVLASRTISRGLASLGERRLSNGKYRRYWERVTRLFPFGEKCFEAAVVISAASLVTRELEWIAFVAIFGPRVVQCIGIFFTTRVLIELASVMLQEGFGIHDERRSADQKGQTLVPLLQSILQYAMYFGSAVVMLGVLGVDTGPILAGAGILGLAGGLGAQSLITDVVSGFFILFENQYLVGDFVQIGDATGKVEAVSIRLTQIRDESGKLHIVPNGQVKSVVNFSKGYVNAVVDLKVPTSSDLEQTLRDMAEAGRRLKAARREVVAETEVKGLVELTPGDMTLRAVTRVAPGTHLAMQNEYRRFLKEVFDENAARAAKLPPPKMSLLANAS
jgi:small-conductance mechanosensitive channel